MLQFAVQVARSEQWGLKALTLDVVSLLPGWSGSYSQRRPTIGKAHRRR